MRSLAHMTAPCRAFHNNGDGSFTQLVGPANPFNGVDVGDRATPTFVDLNFDGKLDAIVGNHAGTLLAFHNNLPPAPAITISVTAENDAPVAVDDVLAATEDQPVTFTAAQLVGNDTDGDNDTLFIDSVTAVTGGGVVRNGDGSVTFSPAVNFFGPASFAYVVSDGNGGTDTGAATVNVAPVNDQPSGANATLTIDEDTTHVFVANDFGFSDLENTLQAVKITTTVTVGTLYWDSDAESGTPPVAVADGDEIPVADIDAGRLTFVPGLNANGGNYASFTFQVRDDGGAPGTDLDQTPNNFTIDVTPINDAPVATTSAGATAFVEGLDTDSTPVVVDPGLVVSDVDSPKIVSAVVQITVGEGSDDLDFVNDDAMAYGNIAIDSDLGGAITLSSAGATATLAQWQNALRAVTYTSTSDTPLAGDHVVTFSVTDGTDISEYVSRTISVTPADDSPVATDDSITTSESVALTGADAFANDFDPDLPTLQVGAVNGSADDVGVEIELDSGALLTMRWDGTYDYDPNGAFDWLISPAKAAATGAVNISATDSFTYSLVGGNTATVTVTINGEDGPGDELHGTSGDDDIIGTEDDDHFDLSQGGNDSASGLAGNDFFVFGATFDGLDTIDGGADFDWLVLEGDYATSPLVLSATSLVDIDVIVVVHGHDYDITLDDANIAAGATMMIQSVDLQNDTLVVDGSQETDGNFLFLGGEHADDEFHGGAGNDLFFGNGGDNILDGNFGIDTVAYGGPYFTTLGPVDVDLALGIADNGFGDTDQLDRIENVIGSDFGDEIDGNSLDNRLDGGGAADLMRGGDGNDTYVVDNVGDVASEFDALGSPTGGTDTVESAISYILPNLIETLVLTGTANIDGTGNSAVNVLTGNAAITSSMAARSATRCRAASATMSITSTTRST